MTNRIYRVWRKDEYNKAGQNDLIALKPSKGGNHLYILKFILEILVHSICDGEFIHLSGPSGSAKSALIETLMLKENFLPLVSALNMTRQDKYPLKPLMVFPIEMPTFETPGEFQFRRALANGTTYDEESNLVKALKTSQKLKDSYYLLIWLREIGRTHSSSVQGGLLNLMSKTEIILRNNERLDGNHIAWIADSNYQADQDSHFTLVPLDTALKRRFCINITLGYLSEENEELVMAKIIENDTNLKVDPDLIKEVVKLGTIIRKMQLEGNLESVPPPTIYGYLAYYKMAMGLSHMSRPIIAQSTLLGHANSQDLKLLPSVLNHVYSLELIDNEEDGILEGNIV